MCQWSLGDAAQRGSPSHSTDGPEGLREPRAPKGTSPQSSIPLEPSPSPPAPPGPPHPADTEESKPVSSLTVLFLAASQGPLRNDLLPDSQAGRDFTPSLPEGCGSPSPASTAGRQESPLAAAPVLPPPPADAPSSNLQPSTLGIHLLNATSAPRAPLPVSRPSLCSCCSCPLAVRPPRTETSGRAELSSLPYSGPRDRRTVRLSARWSTDDVDQRCNSRSHSEPLFPRAWAGREGVLGVTVPSSLGCPGAPMCAEEPWGHLGFLPGYGVCRGESKAPSTHTPL